MNSLQGCINLVIISNHVIHWISSFNNKLLQINDRITYVNRTAIDMTKMANDVLVTQQEFLNKQSGGSSNATSAIQLIESLQLIIDGIRPTTPTKKQQEGGFCSDMETFVADFRAQSVVVQIGGHSYKTTYQHISDMKSHQFLEDDARVLVRYGDAIIKTRTSTAKRTNMLEFLV